MRTAVPELDRMEAISLAQLDERAGLLTRQDNKYLVPEPALWSLLHALRTTHQALEIAGRRTFSYDSVYFDTEDLELHRAHVQGRRLRFKARTRHYDVSGTTYQEIKLKGARGATVKLRQRCDGGQHGLMTRSYAQFLDAALRQHHGVGLQRELHPTAVIRYQRATLVSRTGAERLTVDRELDVLDRWGNPRGHLRKTVALLEVKTEHGRGLADDELRRRRHHPVSVSKYGLAVAHLQPNQPHPRLRAVLMAGFVPPVQEPEWVGSRLTSAAG